MSRIDRRLVLPPYRRRPDEYVCSECQQPADGYERCPGIVMFYCVQHHDLVDGKLWALFSPGYSVGMGIVRQGWRYYMASFYWRLVNLRHLRANIQSTRVLKRLDGRATRAHAPGS